MRYNNKFLRMYLTDICSLHLAERELSQRISKLQTKIEKANTQERYSAPANPHCEPVFSGASLAGLAVGAFLAGVSLIGWVTGNAPGGFSVIAIGGIIVGVAIIAAIVRSAMETKQLNDLKLKQYEEAYDSYTRARRALAAQKERERALVPQHQEKIELYRREIAKIVQMRNRAYALNIIGLRYRDIYAAMYLYEYFCFSKEESLSMAINTYVLEQIKEKLDKMIELQAESILNQRIQIANQELAIEEQRQTAREMKSQIRHLTSEVDKQNEYLDMIETNTAVSAYFSAATYFKNK